MKIFRTLLIVSLFALCGCASTDTIPLVQPQGLRPDTKPVNMTVDIIQPDEFKTQSKISNDYTQTIPVGKLIRTLNRQTLMYSFSNATLLPDGSAADAPAVLTVSLDDFSYIPVQVAAGFGIKYDINLTLRGTMRDRNGLVIWDKTVRSKQTSRSVVSPIIPSLDMKAEVLAVAMADAYRQLAEEIETAPEIKKAAGGVQYDSAPVVQAVPQTTEAIVHRARLEKLVNQTATGQTAAAGNAAGTGRGGQTAAAPTYNSLRGFAGFTMQNVTKQTAGYDGVRVVQLMSGAPGANAGLMPGDIIITVNGQPVTDGQIVQNFVGGAKAGTDVYFGVMRGGSMLNKKVTVETAPVDYAAYAAVHPMVGEAVVAQAVQTQDQTQEQPEQPQADLPAARPDTFAVVIGIDYGNRKDIPHLKYAASDAKEVYDLLTDRRYGGVPKENSILLLNDQATRSNIIAALRKAKTWDGYVYVYYTGHGAPVTSGNKVTDAMIVPDDAVISDPDSMEDTSVKISYIDDLVNESAAKGVLVALDACFTGTGKSITAEGGKPIVGMLVSNDLIKTSGEGKVIITSSAANQQSWEDDGELKSGIFSHYFIEGLKNAGTGVWVTINDLAGYLKDNVSKTAFKLKGQDQTPQVTGKGDFVVSRSWARSQTMDVDLGMGKLKAAFEKGSISSDQLSRAMDELKSGKPSKLLQVFLSGKLDAKKFGDLY